MPISVCALFVWLTGFVCRVLKNDAFIHQFLFKHSVFHCWLVYLLFFLRLLLLCVAGLVGRVLSSMSHAPLFISSVVSHPIFCARFRLRLVAQHRSHTRSRWRWFLSSSMCFHSLILFIFSYQSILCFCLVIFDAWCVCAFLNMISSRIACVCARTCRRQYVSCDLVTGHRESRFMYANHYSKKSKCCFSSIVVTLSCVEVFCIHFFPPFF